MIQSEVFEKIQFKLSEIELEYNVQILYAIESGSRAWGFESKDSDYDVRFLYKHQKDWYLSILPKRDVIEIPIVDLMDYSGWDLRKSFFLMNKSNPVLFEWLHSPIIYRKEEQFYYEFLEVAKQYFSPLATAYHYLHMASRNYREYLKSDLVKVKKYFYVLRPLLACKWVEVKGTIPPIEFEVLLDELVTDHNLIKEIKELLYRKRNGLELGEENKIAILNNYIEEQIEHFNSYVSTFNPADKPDPEVMNIAFRRMLSF